jgi:hypothetical protein
VLCRKMWQAFGIAVARPSQAEKPLGRQRPGTVRVSDITPFIQYLWVKVYLLMTVTPEPTLLHPNLVLENRVLEFSAKGHVEVISVEMILGCDMMVTDHPLLRMRAGLREQQRWHQPQLRSLSDIARVREDRDDSVGTHRSGITYEGPWSTAVKRCKVRDLQVPHIDTLIASPSICVLWVCS